MSLSGTKSGKTWKRLLSTTYGRHMDQDRASKLLILPYATEHCGTAIEVAQGMPTQSRGVWQHCIPWHGSREKPRGTYPCYG